MTTAKQDRLLSIKQIQERVQISRVSVWRWEKEGKFPKHVKLGSIARWKESEIQQWIADLRAVEGGKA